MSLPENKLVKFTSAILKDAGEQRETILTELEEYRKNEIEKAEEEVLHESFLMIQNEIAAVKNAHSKKISLAELDSRRKLLKLREEIAAEVFRDAAKKILNFTKTDPYREFLGGLVAKCASSMPAGEVTISVKPDDLVYSDYLLSQYGRPAKVEASAVIELGGVIVFNHDEGMVLDETLDLRLAGQKDWFAAASKLSIG
jgi:V/A-type H+-transporting ATPase subunit E